MRGNEAFFQYGPPQSFFELSWLALQKARARKVAQRLMTGRKFLSPPLLWLAPQSNHGSAACAETEAFFQFGPPQSFFELSWLALQKARAREVGANFYAPARSAIRSWECRVRGNCSFFPIWPAILFRAKLACPTKKARRAQIWMSGHLAASACLAHKKHVGNSARMMTGTNF